MPPVREWDLHGDLVEVGRVAAELQTCLAPVLGGGAHDLALAVEELLANAATHGSRISGRTPRLRVRCTNSPGLVQIEVRDDGPLFDPLGATSPDLNLPLDERPQGGLGVFLVRRLVKSVRYERQGNENVVFLAHSVAPGV